MKIWLDDERPAPPGWKHCLWPDEVIKLLKTGTVTEISLDHDLGNDARGTGMDVLNWLENAVADPTIPSVGRATSLKPPKINIHTANPSRHRPMVQLAQRIHRFYSDPRFRVAARVASRHTAKPKRQKTRHVVIDMPSTNRPPPQFNKMEPTEVLGYLRWLLLDHFEMEDATQSLKQLGQTISKGMKTLDRWRRFRRTSSSKVAMRHLALQGPMDCAEAGVLGYRLTDIMQNTGEGVLYDYAEYIQDAADNLVRLSETYEGSHSLDSTADVADEQAVLLQSIRKSLMRAFRGWREFVEYRDRVETSYRLAQEALRLSKRFDGS